MRRDHRFDDLDNAALRAALLAMHTCPTCRADLVPVALCEDVYGCPQCRETWHLPADVDTTRPIRQGDA